MTGLAVSTPALPQTSPEQRDLAKTRRTLGQWQRDLRAADAALVAGDHEKGIRKATQVLRDTEKKVISGDVADQLLGTAFVLRAIGFHQAGELERASWSWFSGLAVWPDAADLTMSAYGPAGPWLKALEAREPGDLETVGLTLRASDHDYQPPRKKHSPAPDFPRGQRYRGGGRLGISTIIGTDGRPRRPVLLTRSGPSTFVSATLEKLEQWRFDPAELDGEPVAVVFNLTVNFQLRR